MSDPAHIVGAFEHPTRKAPDKSVGQIHAESARGALEDAGLTPGDVDGYFCAGDAPGMGPLDMAEYMGLRGLRHLDGTDIGGSSYLAHVGHAALAIAQGRCDVALVTLGGRPRSEGSSGTKPRSWGANVPADPFELPYGRSTVGAYALCAARHMHEFGTTAEQLAWIKVAASHHAQHNPHAMLRRVVTVEEVLASPMVSDPLHRMDCCVVSDGGGALVVARAEVARSLGRPRVAAFAQAGVTPADIQYASIYDSFTITVLMQLEDLGFCEKGQGGRFVADGNLISGVGKLPFNTDGGGLCNNHPANRGGITKVIEAVRQLRGEAHPAVQVPNCTLALAHGTGGLLGLRHGSATLILERQ